LEYLKKRGIGSRYDLYESRLSDLSGIECGKRVGVNNVVDGQYLDITGYSVGKGFAGAIKRHSFSGLRASHGVSIAHRSQGSTGQCQDPGRVFKGKKMPGHLGGSRVTAQNVKVLFVDHENSIIALKCNNIPGFRNSYIFVRDAVEKPLRKDVPFPVGLLLDANDGNVAV
jgi:large subunit ribosomal protein L3